MPMRLTFNQIRALLKLAIYAKGTSLELLADDRIYLIDYRGIPMIVRWNERKQEYFRDTDQTLGKADL